MDKNSEHITYLWQQYIADKATTQELEELFSYHSAHADDEEQSAIAEQILSKYPAKKFLDPEAQQHLLRQILSQQNARDLTLPIQHRIHFLKTAWFRYAAVLLLILGTASLLYRTYNKPQKEIVQSKPLQQPKDILPGSDKAILTLAGGEQIRLDSNANGLLAAQGIRNRNAMISYTNSAALATTNVLTTPKGGQYKLQLADGTIVWLNAASSITYPTAFTEGKREVTINGEAYFEVAANKEKPFIVNTGSDVIQVLGTAFNVNAYTDEPLVKTTLVEGSIKIDNTVLKRGQAYGNGKVIATNIDQDIAWKNGWFAFTNADLPTVMRQLARWYNVEVTYQGVMPKGSFNGEIDRGLTLNQALEGLGDIGVHYKIANKHIILSP